MLRLLRAIPTDEIARRISRLLDDPISKHVTATALESLPRLFGSPGAPGGQMAARASGPLEDADTVQASLAALTEALIHELDRAL